jgi:autotransporter-associated beta strand protein
MYFFRLLLASISILASVQVLFAAPWRFVVFGDTRSDSGVNSAIVSELANRTVAEGAEFVLVTGDLAVSGSAANFQTWKNAMAPAYNAGIGVYPIIGNHDANDTTAFINAFGADLPDNGPAGETDRTYALAYDNVLILGLDEYVTSHRVNQNWVTQQLQQRDPAVAEHVFTFGHEPAFKAHHTDCMDDYATQRNTFWNSLKIAGGRAYFCGHDHFFDHARINDGDGDLNNDVHQYIAGNGGAPFYNGYSYDGSNSPFTPVNVLHDENRYGYLVVDVNGPTVTMTYKYRVSANNYATSTDVFSYTAAPPATLTWDGGGGNAYWNTATNWNLDNLPAGGSPLTFSGSTRQTNSNNSSLVHVGLITFSNGGFSISGNALTLDAGIVSTGNNAWGINSTLNAAQTFTSNASGLLTVTGTVNTNGQDLTFAGAGDHSVSGNITGGGNLNKTGEGKLTLNAANTYLGDTTISAGTLALGSAGSLQSNSITLAPDAKFDVSLPTGGFDLATGRTLKGTGTILGNLTIHGTHAPGSSPGIQTLQGDYALAGNLELDLLDVTPGSGYDQILLSGPGNFNALLSGTLTLDWTGFGGSADDSMLWILRNDTLGSLSGGFGNYLNGDSVGTHDDRIWRIWYGADVDSGQLTGGNDVVLTPVPEPTLWLILSGGLISWAFYYLGRRKLKHSLLLLFS